MRQTWIAFICLLAGCVPIAQKGEAYFNAVRPVATEKTSVIFIYRYGEVLGYYRQSAVSVDGKLVGTLEPSGFLYVSVSPGSHRISESATANLPLESGGDLTLVTEARKTYFVKVDIDVQLKEHVRGSPIGLVGALGGAIGGAMSGAALSNATGYIRRDLLLMDEQRAENELWYCNRSERSE